MKTKHSFTTTLWLVVSTIMVIGSCPGGIIVSQRISGFAGNTLLILGTIAFFVLGILGWGFYFEVVAEAKRIAKKNDEGPTSTQSG